MKKIRCQYYILYKKAFCYDCYFKAIKNYKRLVFFIVFGIK